MAIKKRIYLTLIIFAFLIILIIVFIVFPLFGEIKNNSKELIVQKEKFVVLETKIANLEKFKVLQADLQYFLKEIDNLFVDPIVPVEFIGFLENTSEKSGLETEIMPVGSDKKMEKGFWPYLTFQITSSGSFSNFLKFLEKIENGPYLIEVQNLSISKLTGDKDIVFDKVRVAFSIKVFVK